MHKDSIKIWSAVGAAQIESVFQKCRSYRALVAAFFSFIAALTGGDTNMALLWSFITLEMGDLTGFQNLSGLSSIPTFHCFGGQFF